MNHVASKIKDTYKGVECKLCYGYYKNEKELRKHIERRHPEKSEIAKLSKSRELTSNAHDKKDNDTKSYKELLKDIATRSKISYSWNSHICKVCKARFENKTSLNFHFYENHNKDDEAKTKYYKMAEYYKRKKTKIETNIEEELDSVPVAKKPKFDTVDANASEECNDITETVETAEKVLESVKKDYPCENCDKEFNTKPQLNMHMKKKHSLAENCPSVQNLGHLLPPNFIQCPFCNGFV